MEAPDFFILLVLDPALVKKGSIARISDYIDERIDLSKYGDAVKGITYSPTISEKMPERHRSNKNKYLRKRKEWFLTIDLDFAKAIQMADMEYDQYVLSGLLECLERPGEVKGFDKAAFKKDIEKVVESFLRQIA
ncbi:MAG: hypothetical protein J5I98_28300 [Phaeodactylibacter sp.]|nr:hypothetical protein [Phaeodactylibacter sp.]